YEDTIDPVHIGIQQLQAHIRRAVDENARPVTLCVCALNQKRAATPPVLGIVRVAGTPAQRNARYAHRRSAAENREGQAHAASASSRGTLLNRRKKFSVVCCAISSADTPRASARTLAVSTTYAGSLRFPRNGSGARYGASVSTRTRSGGRAAAISRNAPEFLNVRMPVNDT